MKWKIMGQLYGVGLNATKVSTFLAGYPKADQNDVVDAVDEDGNPYVQMIVVLDNNNQKAAAKQILQDAVTANGITGRLSFHECEHGQYRVDGINSPCVVKEVIL